MDSEFPMCRPGSVVGKLIKSNLQTKQFDDLTSVTLFVTHSLPSQPKIRNKMVIVGDTRDKRLRYSVPFTGTRIVEVFILPLIYVTTNLLFKIS